MIVHIEAPPPDRSSSKSFNLKQKLFGMVKGKGNDHKELPPKSVLPTSYVLKLDIDENGAGEWGKKMNAEFSNYS